jgi:signal transduction histidine kinase
VLIIATRNAPVIGSRSLLRVPPRDENFVIGPLIYDHSGTSADDLSTMTSPKPLGSVGSMYDQPEGLALRPPLLHRVASGHLQAIDFALAFLLLFATVPHLVGDSNGSRIGPGGAVLVLALGAALPIAIRRRAPIAALSIATIAISIATAIGQSFAPDPLIAIPLYQVAAVRDRRDSVRALVIAGLALVVAAAIGASTHPQESQATFSVLVAVAAWFVGDSVRVRRAYTAGLADQADQRARETLERAQRGVAEERLRIARDLHDVVAHSLSVIAVQSGVGRHVIDSQPDEAKKALSAVETTSRAALVELRRMLGILRQQNPDQANLAPAPGLADLGALAEQIRLTGIPVELNVVVDGAHKLSETEELSVYRITQEALTNVVKHAGRASVRVDVRTTGNALIIEITDDGAGSEEVAESGEWRPFDSADRDDHHGIVGMQERVALFDGTFSAGPRPGGGFRVFARLPFEEQPP